MKNVIHGLKGSTLSQNIIVMICNIYSVSVFFT